MKKLLTLSALVLVLGAGSIQANRNCGAVPGPEYKGESFKCKDVVCPSCPICPSSKVEVIPATFTPERVTQAEVCPTERVSCHKCHHPRHICKGTCAAGMNRNHHMRRTTDMQ